MTTSRSSYETRTQRLLVVSHACVTPINQELFAELQRQSGWEVHLVVPETWEADYGQRAATAWEGFEGALHPLPVWGSGNIPLHVYRTTFQGLLREVRPDAIFVHHEPYGLATAQVFAANRWAEAVPVGFFTWQNIEKQYPPPFRQLERWVLKTSAFAFTGSDSAAEVLRAKGYAGALGRMPGTIHPGRFAPKDTRTAWCQQHGIGHDNVLVGYAGRLIRAKGLFTLIEALAQVEASAVELVLIGTGDDAEALKAHTRRHGVADRVTWVSYVPHPDMPHVLSAMDMMVLPSETQPSWKEQFGRIIIESLACETPVIGSDSGEIPHLLRQLQQDTIFAEGDAAALARHIIRLAEDPAARQACGMRGRAAVLEQFTVQHVAARCITVLSDHTPLIPPVDDLHTTDRS